MQKKIGNGIQNLLENEKSTENSSKNNRDRNINTFLSCYGKRDAFAPFNGCKRLLQVVQNILNITGKYCNAIVAIDPLFLFSRKYKFKG
eukprot:snap_masked-scaffold_37-processed-gene-2.57-mRNA-1 protein AED:1.00 eAED:1.00 QI:0/0/0/0/1/1/2/0/88